MCVNSKSKPIWIFLIGLGPFFPYEYGAVSKKGTFIVSEKAAVNGTYIGHLVVKYLLP